MQQNTHVAFGCGWIQAPLQSNVYTQKFFYSNLELKATEIKNIALLLGYDAVHMHILTLDSIKSIECEGWRRNS